MSTHKIHPLLTEIDIAYKIAVKRLRTQLCLSQVQFARNFQIVGKHARFTIGRWERLSSPHMPTTKHKLRMRELFEMNRQLRGDPEKLLTGRDETSLAQVDFSV